MGRYNIIVQLGRIDVKDRRVSFVVETKDVDDAIGIASANSVAKFKEIHGETNPILGKLRHVVSVELVKPKQAKYWKVSAIVQAETKEEAIETLTVEDVSEG